MSISAGVHFVSGNHLQGLPVKKTTLLSRDLLLKNKCPLYFQPLARVPLSLTCKASSSNNNRRIPRLPKKKYNDPPPSLRSKFNNHEEQEDLLETSQMLSSQNGGSRISDAPTPIKSGNSEEIIKIFRKHLSQMQAETRKPPVNSNPNIRSYGLNATMLNDEEKRNSIKEIIKQLSTSGTNKKSVTNNIGTKGTINNLSKYVEADVEDSDSENIDEDSDFEDDVPDMLDSDEDSDFEDDVPDMLDSEPKPVTSSRPPSRFSRKSPVPVEKYEPIVPSETYEGETQMLSEEEKSGSEYLVYESESESLAEQSEGQHLGEKIEDLGALKVSELREIAKSRGLKGYSKLKKAELVEQLSLS
ncbi:Rho termination factor [Carex littledalei]|uniref:Rho termination factor n=1 Tax=Carex littledalei TaxID=544730 RepID=A0A833R9L4_9POAL|nr:Rho termination factor [Carex littledalei]